MTTTLSRDLHLSITGKVIIGRTELVARCGIIKDGAIAKLGLGFNGRVVEFAGTMSVRGTDVVFVAFDGMETLLLSDSYNNLTIHSFKWLRVAV